MDVGKLKSVRFGLHIDQSVKKWSNLNGAILFSFF